MGMQYFNSCHDICKHIRMYPTTTAGVSESADDGGSDGFVSMEASNMTTSLTTDSEQGKC